MESARNPAEESLATVPKLQKKTKKKPQQINKNKWNLGRISSLTNKNGANIDTENRRSPTSSALDNCGELKNLVSYF